uniref:VQ motif family protein n=1 Tax=Zea mays TaxID=4577 RepID=B6SS41_MAIZE|nr:VQ motif family protein [Zea mays]
MGEYNDGVSTSWTIRAAHRGIPPPTRPKIKIIHIIAPEIIKTDVAHFRDLVQRLTGKPASCAASSTGDDDVASMLPPVEDEDMETTTKKRPRPRPAPPPAAGERSDFTKAQEEPVKKRKIKCEVKVEEQGAGFGDYDLGHGDLWMDLNPGGFLSFLEEEGVFQGLAAAADHDFLQPFGSSRMDLVGEMHAS